MAPWRAPNLQCVCVRVCVCVNCWIMWSPAVLSESSNIRLVCACVCVCVCVGTNALIDTSGHPNDPKVSLQVRSGYRINANDLLWDKQLYSSPAWPVSSQLSVYICQGHVGEEMQLNPVIPKTQKIHVCYQNMVLNISFQTHFVIQNVDIFVCEYILW